MSPLTIKPGEFTIFTVASTDGSPCDHTPIIYRTADLPEEYTAAWIYHGPDQYEPDDDGDYKLELEEDLFRAILNRTVDL